MKLAVFLLLVALVGKMSAAPVAYRLAYYRAAPPQQQLDEEPQDDDDETEISAEDDFSQDNINQQIADDDDDSEEQEEPPQFNKLFPLPQANTGGYNFRKGLKHKKAY